MILDHGGQVLDDLHPVSLDPDSGRVSRRMGVLGAHHCSNGRFLVVTSRGMCYIGPKEDHRFVENLWPNAGHQDVVDTAQLDVDLETQVGKSLGRCLVDIFGLDTLGSHPKDCVAHSLHFSINRSLAG